MWANFVVVLLRKERSPRTALVSRQYASGKDFVSWVNLLDFSSCSPGSLFVYCLSIFLFTMTDLSILV